MRVAVLLILFGGLTSCVVPPDPQVALGLLSVVEVTVSRLLDGDPAGAAQALAALVRH